MDNTSLYWENYRAVVQKLSTCSSCAITAWVTSGKNPYSQSPHLNIGGIGAGGLRLLIELYIYSVTSCETTSGKVDAVKWMCRG